MKILFKKSYDFLYEQSYEKNVDPMISKKSRLACMVMSPKLQNTNFRWVSSARFVGVVKIAFFAFYSQKVFFLRKAECFLYTHLQPNSAVVMSPKLQNTNFRWKRPEHFFFFKSHFSAFYSQKTRFWGSGRRGVFLFAQLQLNSAVEIPPKLLNTNSGWKPRAVFLFFEIRFFAFFSIILSFFN